MKLSPNEIAYVAAFAGFTGDDLVNAVAVCLAESGGDTDVIARSANLLTNGEVNPNAGNRDHGLWQISNRWHQRNGDGTPGKLLLVGAQWRNPYVNARLAKQIYDAAKGWTPWSVWGSGSYKTYLPDAKIAVLAPWAP